MIHPRVLFSGNPAAVTPWVGIAKKLARECYDLKIVSKLYQLGSDVRIRVQNVFPIAGTLDGICKVWIEAGGKVGTFIGYPRNSDSIYGWQTVDGALENLTSYMRITSHRDWVTQPGNGFRLFGYKEPKFVSIAETNIGYGQQYGYAYTYDETTEQYVKGKYPICSWCSASSGDLPARIRKVTSIISDIEVAYNREKLYYITNSARNANSPFLPFLTNSSSSYVYLAYLNPSSIITTTINWIYNSSGTSVIAGFTSTDLIFGVHVITPEVFIVITVKQYIDSAVGGYYTNVSAEYKFWLVDTRSSTTNIKEEYILKDYTIHRIPSNTIFSPILYKYPFRFSETGDKVSTLCTDFVSKIYYGSRRVFERTFIRTWPITITHNEDDTYSVYVDSYTDTDKYTIVRGTEGTLTAIGDTINPSSTYSVNRDETDYLRTYKIDDNGNLSDRDIKIPYTVNYLNNTLTVCYATYDMNINVINNSLQIGTPSNATKTLEKTASGTAKLLLSFDEDDDNNIELYNVVNCTFGSLNDDYGFDDYTTRNTYISHGDPSYGAGTSLFYSTVDGAEDYYDSIIVGEGSTQYFMGLPMYLDTRDRKLFVKNYSRRFLYKSHREYVDGNLVCTVTDKYRNIHELYKLTNNNNGEYELSLVYADNSVSNEEEHILDLNVNLCTNMAEVYSPVNEITSLDSIVGGYSNESANISVYLGVPQYLPNIDLSSSFAFDNNNNYLYCSELFKVYIYDYEVVIDSSITGLNSVLASNIGDKEDVSIIPVGFVTQQI